MAVEQRRGPVAPLDVGAGGGQGRSDHPVAVDLVVGEPLREVVLARRQGGAGEYRFTVDPAPQLVQRDELLRGDRLGGEPLERAEQLVAALAQRAYRPDGGRGWVVDLVGEPCGQGAEGHQGLALSGVGLDPAGGRDQPPEQVGGEREPRVSVRTEPLRRDPEDSAGPRGPAAAHVDAVLVPGPEAARPLAGDLHGREHRLLVPDPAHQVDVAVEQQPPVVSRPALVEEPLPLLEDQLLPVGRQLGDLLVAEPVEEREAAEVVVQHQIVAR